MPKNSPIATETRNATTTEYGATTSWNVPNFRLPTTTPMATPSSPPNIDSSTASSRNWPTMSPRCAPMALRMPISRVRSVTVTSMDVHDPDAAHEQGDRGDGSQQHRERARRRGDRGQDRARVEDREVGVVGVDVVAVGEDLRDLGRGRVHRVRAGRLHRDAGQVAVAGEGVLHGGERGDDPVVLVLR